MKDGKKKENLAEEVFDLGRFFELAISEKIYVNNLNLHEVKSETLQDYTGDIESNGVTIIGPIEQKSINRYKNNGEFKSCIDAIYVEYVSEDVTFTGYVYELKTPQFKIVKRSTYGKGSNYMQEIVEYHGQNCSIPTSGIGFIKFINRFTKKDYTEEFLTFIRTEQRRSNVMTSARIQPFCRK